MDFVQDLKGPKRLSLGSSYILINPSPFFRSVFRIAVSSELYLQRARLTIILVMQTSLLLLADSQLVLASWLGVVEVIQTYAVGAGSLQCLIPEVVYTQGNCPAQQDVALAAVKKSLHFLFQPGTTCKSCVAELTGSLSDGQVKDLLLTLGFFPFPVHPPRCKARKHLDNKALSHQTLWLWICSHTEWVPYATYTGCWHLKAQRECRIRLPNITKDSLVFVWCMCKSSCIKASMFSQRSSAKGR